MFVTLAQYSGCDTVVYCVQDGADALVKGAIREKGQPSGVPTFEQRLRVARKTGVRFQLCEQVAMNRHLTEKDLIEGVKIAGGIHLIVYALEYDGCSFFRSHTTNFMQREYPSQGLDRTCYLINATINPQTKRPAPKPMTVVAVV